MIVDCPACGASYNISDDKVRGRRVRVRCKSCGDGIVVDGAHLESDDSTRVYAPVIESGDATRVYSPNFQPSAYARGGDSDESTRVVSPAGPNWREPGPGDWTVNLSDTEQRTMTTEEIVNDYNGGIVTDDAYVWRDGMSDWLPLLQVPQIRAALDSGEATRVVSPAVAARAPLGPRGATARAATAPTPVTYSAPAAPPRARLSSAPAASIEYAPARVPPPPAVAPPRAPPPPAALPAPTRPPAPAARPAPAAARTREGARGRADLFGQVEAAGAEDALLGGSSLEQYGEKPSGARNENSVLFSLNTLKASAPRSPASAPPRLNTASPRTAADILGMSAGGALPGMDATAALLSAPAVEAPPPRPPPAAPQARDTTPPAARAKGRALMVAAVVAVAGAGAGGAFLVLRSRLAPQAVATAETTIKAAPPAPSPGTPNPTTLVAAAAPAPAAAPTPAPAAAQPAPEAAARVAEAPAGAPAMPGAAAAAGAKGPAPRANGLDAMKAAMRPEGTKGEAAAPADKPSGKGGKLVLAEEGAAAPAPAAAAEPAAEEKPAEAEKPPFDTGAAKAALEGAATAASSCKKPDGPTGRGKVQVTFSPSGRATSANVLEGPFGGTPVGGCVAKAFRASRVPAFSGDPVSVSKSFTIPE
jgi:predicted Zn finger-like uncharacterized protein